MMEQVIGAQRKKLGDQHPAIAGSEINLGSLLVDSGDADAAERVLGESAAIFDKKYGREYQGTRMALRTLAAAHAQQGKLDLAEKELNEIRAQEDKLDLRAKEGDETDINLGDVRRLQGDAKAAIELSREALAISIKRNGDNSRYAADAHQHLAMALRDSGDDAGAEREFRASLVSRASYLPNAEHPFGATTRCDLALLLLTHPDGRAEAERLLSEAASIREKLLGADDPTTRQARDALRQAHAAQP
jgi:tetratricopeptide (TPR) repeat protein